MLYQTSSREVDKSAKYLLPCGFHAYSPSLFDLPATASRPAS